ncbi:FtsX-like permease family protein [Shewanella schlegeliana]|uniref:ABC transporter permease n=1 Tax=Shewanella schlegeliana TaxID=190308 RepID=A0ABS1T1H3_9GAMM|nr:FtsX-like permease family protein [Shewanella schlegeliana]MBL4914636.1 ABC transporter permease [Shewanella schlegeliana]MCL1109548.1 FtsX-like permease family protein [Shewanella schlegeliana]GIU29658.1 ABC transporter permease [Shewanella schlegeliana]
MSGQILLAWRSLWQHKRRTWLTLGAMIFCNSLLVFMITLQAGTYPMMIENTLRIFSSQLQINQQGYLDEPELRKRILDSSHLIARIEQEFPELDVIPRSSGFLLAASAQRSVGMLVNGVAPDKERLASIIPQQIIYGHYLEAGDNNQVVLGERLAKNLQVTVGDELTVMGSTMEGGFAAGVLSVVGIFSTGINELDRTVSQISMATFQRLFEMPNQVSLVSINAPSMSQVSFYQRQLQALMQTEPKLTVHDWQQLNPGIKQGIEADLSSAVIMYAVLVLLVILGVMNTQLMAVLERTKEFGIMLAIGSKPSRLFTQVLIETLMMGIIGMLLGALLGGVVAGYFSLVGIALPGMGDIGAQFGIGDRIYPLLSPLSVLIGPVVVCIGSVLVSIYPAFKTLGLEPISAMQSK